MDSSKEPDRKLNWMYKGVSGLVDKEDYLTGRKIDKTFEIIRNEEEKETKGDFEGIEGSIPSSILAQAKSQTKVITVDLEAKVREDPLYEIRKREIEQKKKILNNPLKMKRIKEMLERVIDDSSTSKDDRNSRKTRESSHRSKHRRDRSKSSDRKQKNAKSSPKSSHRKIKSTRSNKNDDNEKYSRHRNSRSRSVSRERHRKRSRSKSPDHSNHSYNIRHHRNTSPHRSHHHSRPSQRSSHQPAHKSHNEHHKPDTRRKELSADELEKRRAEMMKDAQERDRERKSRVEKYSQEAKQEETKLLSRENGSFMRPLLSAATDKVTLEGRIKQRMFSSQRGESSMSSNFARR